MFIYQRVPCLSMLLRLMFHWSHVCPIQVPVESCFKAVRVHVQQVQGTSFQGKAKTWWEGGVPNWGGRTAGKGKNQNGKGKYQTRLCFLCSSDVQWYRMIKWVKRCFFRVKYCLGSAMIVAEKPPCLIMFVDIFPPPSLLFKTWKILIGGFNPSEKY